MRSAVELPGRFGYDRAEHRLHVAEAHLTLGSYDRAAHVARESIAAAPAETPGWAAATLVLALAEARDTPDQAASRALGVLDLIPPPRLRATARERLTRLGRLLDGSTPQRRPNSPSDFASSPPRSAPRNSRVTVRGRAAGTASRS